MNDWEKLKARYNSKAAYTNRKVIDSRHDYEDFQDYLINTCGAEIQATPKQDEAMRFKMPDGELGIIYGKGSGNLTAHNVGMRYCRDNGVALPPDFNINVNYAWSVPVKNPNHGMPGNSEPGLAYEYCYGCKEVQPLSGDQCAVCHCYIKF